MTNIYQDNEEDALDTSERALFDLLNAYRVSLSLAPISLSKALTTTASRHVVDLLDNHPRLQGPAEPGVHALHGWSDAPYSGLDPTTFKSMLRAPQRLGTGYTADAFEILIGAPSTGAWTELTSRQALDLFLSSPAHREVIESAGNWSGVHWGAIGVAIRGGYVSVWFGFPPDAAAPALVAHDDPVGIGTNQDIEFFRGSTEFRQNDIFLGGSGRNIFQASGGWDVFVGGGGQNQAEFRGSLDEYTVEVDQGMIRVTDKVSGRDGSVLVVNFEPDAALIFKGDGRLVTVAAAAGDSLERYRIVLGSGGEDYISGSSEDSFVIMRGKADIYQYHSGNAVVAAGPGWDIIEFTGPVANYQLEEGPHGFRIYGKEGNVYFTDVELLVFSDQVLSIERPSFFDEDYYLSNNTDVARAVESGNLVSGYEHWQQYGHMEGRLSTRWFDAEYYLSHNPDVAAAVRGGGVTAWTHYQAFGAREGRDPSALFDASAYLDANPDVRTAGVNPLEHWVVYGWSEGRRVAPVDDYWTWS